MFPAASPRLAGMEYLIGIIAAWYSKTRVCTGTSAILCHTHELALHIKNTNIPLATTIKQSFYTRELRQLERQ